MNTPNTLEKLFIPLRNKSAAEAVLPVLEHVERELLVGVAVKTISNYLDHLSPIETDTAFQAGRAA